jgi:signal transduction histidine kinase
VSIEAAAPDALVDVDPDRVEQALRNVLENAIRYSPEGGVVRLSAEAADGSVRFVVEDQGPGFPPDLLTSAFDPFARGSGGPGGTGTGLGLAIVRAVAEAHGGTVAAENSPTGARVTIVLRE